jgi:CHAT domain-containing protein
MAEQSQAEWQELPFLLRKYSVSYAYSATLLDRQQANMREHTTADRIPFAGFAPVYKRNTRDPQSGDLLYPISDMKEMVEAVQKMLGGKMFLADSANEQEFRRTAPVCRVLLLAMHGFANESEPTLSRLLFGNPTKGAEPNNVLYTNELQITYLPVDLVVLNACYTGFGKLQRGEGVYSLTRALTSAGVPSTVMSIWQLSGSSSSVLVKMFFQNIKNGMPKDRALQQAKMELLKNPEHASMVHPSFWAGLLATGDVSALKF